VFFLGRISIKERQNDLLFSYLFIIGLCVSFVFLCSLPEIFNQWEIAGPKHPLLYGVIHTAGGTDITLGSLAVLAESAICLDYFRQKQPIRWLMHACVALSMFLLILIASKSVIISVVVSLIILIAAQQRRWRNALSLLIALIVGSAVALAVAPENNIRYYNLVSPHAAVEYFTAHIGSSGIPQAMPDTADTGMIRAHLTLEALHKIIDRPWLGIGAKSWTYNSPHPHNIFLESALMFGIPSFCVLVVFYVIVLWRLLMRPVDKINVFVGAMLLFFLVYNFIQGQLASFRSLPLFLFSGYAVSMVVRKREFSTFGKHKLLIHHDRPQSR
jgi:O-antigen ligase